MRIIKNFMGVFMMILLIIFFIIGGYTIYKKHPEMTLSNFSIYNGDLAYQFTHEFTDQLIIKKTAVALWRAITYGMFNTGDKKIIVGNDGWLFSEEEFIEYQNPHNEINHKLNIIMAVNEYFKSKDIQLIVTIIPSKARIYKDKLGRFQFPKHADFLYDMFHNALIKNNIMTPNLVSLFNSEKNNTQLFLKQDTHWTPEGALLTAGMVASIAKHIDFPKIKFQTILKDKIPYEPDLKKYVSTGFFEKLIEPEKDHYIPHITKSVENKTDLFGDEILPIVLIGTSYSAIQKWNFEGALKTELQADVLNAAMEGKGPMQPMANYLSNNDFNNTKLVIWEIPERFITKPYDDVVFPKFIKGGIQ